MPYLIKDTKLLTNSIKFQHIYQIFFNLPSKFIFRIFANNGLPINKNVLVSFNTVLDYLTGGTLFKIVV